MHGSLPIIDSENIVVTNACYHKLKNYLIDKPINSLVLYSKYVTTNYECLSLDELMRLFNTLECQYMLNKLDLDNPIIKYIDEIAIYPFINKHSKILKIYKDNIPIEQLFNILDNNKQLSIILCYLPYSYEYFSNSVYNILELSHIKYIGLPHCKSIGKIRNLRYNTNDYEFDLLIDYINLIEYYTI